MHPLKISRVLVVSSLDQGSTSWSRAKAWRNLAEEVETVPLAPWIQGLSLWKQVLTNHLYLGPHVEQINRLVLEKARAFRPDLLWIEKGLHLYPKTVKLLKNPCRGPVIHFSPDNQKIRANQSPWYFPSMALYDIHVTTKTHNLEWLRQKGAKRVEVMGKGFDPELHRPFLLSPEDARIYRCDVGFVGHWEPSREEILLWLGRKGYRMKVWGGGWERARHRKHPLFAQAKHLVEDEYVKALCGAKVNLCLLSQWFGDQTTARSVEVPACGKFLLADRTKEHLDLFQEGVEAEFYDSREELIKKLNYYLTHEKERESIGQAARVRCLERYTNQRRLQEVLDRILQGVK